MPEDLIIGGTNKAGTTSVFTYLSEHPQVCGSNVKETAFFINGFTGDTATDNETYNGFFRHCKGPRLVRVEASTGYLAHAATVAERIPQLLESPQLLFVLRAPADRLYSYFNFHVGQLSLPGNLTFEQYVRMSFDHEAGRMDDADIPFSRNFLRVLGQGNYSVFLESFFAKFDRHHIKLTLFEDLKRNPVAFMQDICQFIGIDPDFYANYKFDKSNPTFSSKNVSLHRVAVAVNKKLEPYLRQRRVLKKPLVFAYKRLNATRQGYPAMPPAIRNRLCAYYAPDADRMESLLNRKLPESWRR